MQDAAVVRANDPVPRQTIVTCVLLFVAAFVLLFLGMTRQPNYYDEAIMLTGASRVAAGEVPYRDFYVIYGPAELYIFAGLFKLFGTSVLVTRLFDLTVESLTVAAMYAIASCYARRSYALCTAVVTFLWLYGLEFTLGIAAVPVTLLNLIATALLVPLFTQLVSRKKIAAAGALAGMSFLFRIDTGIGLVLVHACVMAGAVWLWERDLAASFKAFVANLWPYLAGFAAVVVLPATYFLSVSRLYPILLDIFILQSRYYVRYRHLPFPGFHWRRPELLGVYLPVAVVCVALVLLVNSMRRTKSAEHDFDLQRYRGILFAFGLLAFVMFFKSVVRVGLAACYLAMLPAMIVTSMLLTRTKLLPGIIRACVVLIGIFTFVTSLLVSVRETRTLMRNHPVPARVLDVLRGRDDSAFEAAWCRLDNPLTRGFCFISDEPRLRTAIYIESHTRPGQRILDGTVRHDRVFANDNLVYFASQRLPATYWNEYDAGVQSSYEVQAEMVHELEVGKTPYIVLDSELEGMNEPNDSSKSTGVTLLDEYIHGHYVPVQTFGEMAIWQLKP